MNILINDQKYISKVHKLWERIIKGADDVIGERGTTIIFTLLMFFSVHLFVYSFTQLFAL